MDPSQWLILVVEDTFDDQQVVAHLLSFHGAQVLLAANGDEAITLLEEIQPTLIITDLSMPNRDGWQTLSAIRSNPSTARIPIIAVTAYHSSDVAEDALKAGFDAYFPKPLNPITFVQRIDDLLNLRSA